MRAHHHNYRTYEQFLTEQLSSWKTQKLIALAGMVAERWWPAYERFSRTEDWGDSALLRSALNAVWGHIAGTSLTAIRIDEFLEEIEESTPHMDDFAALDALIACVAITDALAACRPMTVTQATVIHGLVGMFEGLVDDWPEDTDEEMELWNSPPIREERESQLRFIERLNQVSKFDSKTLSALRNFAKQASTSQMVLAEPAVTSGMSNQEAFTRYHEILSLDLRGGPPPAPDPSQGLTLFGMYYLGYWSGRYSRRMQILTGEYGPLADQVGVQALLARNRAIDAQYTSLPEWPKEILDIIEMSLPNLIGDDSLLTPQAYGLSLRALWFSCPDKDDDGRWRSIYDWAHRLPSPVMQSCDESHSMLSGAMQETITWKSTGEPLSPWSANVDGATWKISLGDFPDEEMYALEIDREPLGKFYDWPQTWTRSSVST